MTGGTKLHEETTVTIAPSVAAAGADFLMGLSFAQSVDGMAGRLDVAGANGGPANLSAEPFYIGINALGQPVVHGHCTTCHNTPNIGSHSEFRMIDLGLTGPERRAPDVPLVTLRNKTTGEVRQTTDVGRALSTGLWSDVGRFKVPTLRGVGARAPYFHDGSAETLHDVLEFYEGRFGVDFGDAKEDIIAFLEAL
jgi:cytochrome c peroxidase